MARCGVQPGEPSLELARLIQSLPGIRFLGVQGYEGHTVNIKDAAKRAISDVSATTTATGWPLNRMVLLYKGRYGAPSGATSSA